MMEKAERKSIIRTDEWRGFIENYTEAIYTKDVTFLNLKIIIINW